MQTLFAAHTSETNNNQDDLNLEGFVQPSQKVKIKSSYVEDMEQTEINQALDELNLDEDIILLGDSDIDIDDLSIEDISVDDSLAA